MEGTSGASRTVINGSGRLSLPLNITLGYKDKKLDKLLNRYCLGNMKVDLPKGALSEYEKEGITLKNLKNSNYAISYDYKSRKTESGFSSATTAATDHILFSLNKSIIATSSSSCLSVILFCEELKLAAAVHIRALHAMYQFHRYVYKNMFAFAFANMQKLVGGAYPVKAFIAGCNIPGKKSLYPFDRPFRMRGNYNIMRYLLPELIGRQIKIASVDIAGHQINQKLDMQTGEYTIYRNYFEESIIK